MKNANSSLLAGLLMTGILITTPNLIKGITIEDAETLDNSLIAITTIHDANIQDYKLETEITYIAA